MNIFLNEKDPPTLRSLLAQLSWALDCKFFVSGETGQQVYELQPSRAASAAPARVEAEAKVDVQAMKEAPKAIKAMLDEYEAALALSPQDLVAQYQGKDDRLLLNLLEPHRRAAVKFLNLDSIRPQIQKFLDEVDWTAPPGSVVVGTSSHGGSMTTSTGERVPMKVLSEEEIQLLSAALGTTASGYTWSYGASSDGETNLAEPPLPGPNMDFKNCPRLQITRPEEKPNLSPEDAVTLEALIQGTPYSPEEQADRVKQVTEQQALARYAADKEKAEEERPLTPAMVKLLMGTTLDLKEDATFWRVQEAVAKATGMNVVAESIYRGEPTAPPQKPGKPAPPTALSAIERYTRASLAPFRPTRPRPHLAWQWHGAGSFFTFRSGDADLWRAARLPQDFLNYADALVKPFLPKDAATRPRPYQLTLNLPVEARTWTRRLASLTDLQLRFGGKEMYGDPRDPLPLLREPLLSAPQSNALFACRLFALLDDEQWARLTRDGLTDADLKLDQVNLIWQYTGKMEIGSSTPPTHMSVLFGLYDRTIPATSQLHMFQPFPGFYNLYYRLTNQQAERVVPGNAGAGGGPLLPSEVKASVEVPQEVGRATQHEEHEGVTKDTKE